jgi:hypothetical protein
MLDAGAAAEAVLPSPSPVERDGEVRHDVGWEIETAAMAPTVARLRRGVCVSNAALKGLTNQGPQ